MQNPNHRDIFWPGNCDEGSRKLAGYFGWEKELNNLIEKNK